MILPALLAGLVVPAVAAVAVFVFALVVGFAFPVVLTAAVPALVLAVCLLDGVAAPTLAVEVLLLGAVVAGLTGLAGTRCAAVASSAADVCTGTATATGLCAEDDLWLVLCTTAAVAGTGATETVDAAEGFCTAPWCLCRPRRASIVRCSCSAVASSADSI